MESGENPEQSGYCNVEQLHYATARCGKAEKAMKLSQDTCLNKM